MTAREQSKGYHYGKGLLLVGPPERWSKLRPRWLGT